LLAMAPVAVAVALPPFAPEAASTSPTLPAARLSPLRPVADAAPVVFVALPLELLSTLLEADTRAELRAPFLAPPVVTLGSEPSSTDSAALEMPSPAAVPVRATPAAVFTARTSWMLLAEASPDTAFAWAEVAPALADAPPVAFDPAAEAEALPELAPLAASTVPTTPVVVSFPACP